MLKISCAGCLALSSSISTQFTLEMCVQLKMAKNSLKHHFGVSGRSRSSMLVPTESSSAVLATMCSKSVSMCNRSHARRVNSGKLTIS